MLECVPFGESTINVCDLHVHYGLLPEAYTGDG